MAYPGVVVLDPERDHRPRSHVPTTSSPAHARDWRPDDIRLRDSLPHRTRSLSLQHANSHAIAPGHVRRRPSVVAVPAVPRHVPSSWSETSPSPFAAMTMPVLTRPSAAAPYQRPGEYGYPPGGGLRDRERDRHRDPYADAYAHVHAPRSHPHPHSRSHALPDDEHDYPTNASFPPAAGGRRSLRHRQPSPPSAQHYRSTPDTIRSSRTSLSEADGLSAITADTQDERQKPRRARGHDYGQAHVVYGHDHGDDDEDDEDDDDDGSRHIGPDLLRRMGHDSSGSRQSRRIAARPMIGDHDEDGADGSSSSEDAMIPAPLVRRWTDHHPPPSPYELRHHSRHSSRQRSELLSSGSSVRAGQARRSQSAVGEPREIRTLESRLSGKQRDTRAAYADARRPPKVRRSSANPGPRPASASRSPSSSRHRSSLLGSLLSPTAQAKAPEKAEKHGKQAQCVICLDDFASHKIPKLKCGHRMCSTCLKTVFKRSVKEPQEMPPKCCTRDIPLKLVDQLFSTSFKRTWNKKLFEFSTRNRVYCPYKRCGEWIKPGSIRRTDDGRKCAKCDACRMKVCCSCNGKWHSSLKCPRDEETSRILEQAKEAGWQRCYKCQEMVELKEGCNHMTCRCGGQFCMICGSKWKSCECPWFNFETPDEDRVDMQVPWRLDRAALERRDGQLAASKGVARGTYESGVVPNAVRQRAMSYDEEMVMRRLQERQNGDASRRRRQRQLSEDGHGNDHQHQHQHRAHQHHHHAEVELETDEEGADERDRYGRSGQAGERISVGNATGHFMNEDYRRASQHIVVPPSPPPAAGSAHMGLPPGAFEAAQRELGGGSAGDYLADVGRARRTYREDDSAERRLAERFSEARVGLRERALEMGGNPMMGSPPPAVGASLASPGPPPPPPPLQGLGLQMVVPGSMAAMQRMGVPPPPPTPPPAMAPMGAMPGDGMGYGMPPPRLMRASMSDPSGMMTGREPRREDATRGVRSVAASKRPRSSMMAGLSGPGSGMNRVHEWRNHVKPGVPRDGGNGSGSGSGSSGSRG